MSKKKKDSTINMLDKNILIVFKNKYPTEGKVWCMDNLEMTNGQVRYYAQKFSLKSNFKHNPLADFNRGSGFRGKKRPEHSAWLKNNHPMKGKRHSQKTLKIMSIKATEQMKSRNTYSSAKRGYYDINGKNIYFRSMWEANYALYLDFLIKQKDIASWEFEPETFWFEKIRRGVRSYCPDFKIEKADGTVEFHEVKGYMDSKSKTKIKRMAKYYPDTKLIVIDSDCYKDIRKKLGPLLKFYSV